MRLRYVLPALVTVLGAIGTAAHDADACGGCIVPPSENTVVTAHRMALSISPKQTVLWDQIEYAGSPESFAWVLPVKPGAIIQVSNDAWFDTLDAATTTQIFQPQIQCPDSSSGPGFGCAQSDGSVRGASFDESNGSSGGPAVTVVSRGSVGPYLSVTLSTDTPGALNTWLEQNGFALDPATQPVVDSYVAEGFDFIALKLLPDKDVQAMKPVRVVQQGANPALPLRMVAIGSGANVALTLFVIGEGRWEAKNFGNSSVPSDLIAWDFASSSSNYSDLRVKALEQNDGATWLTSFAFQGALLSQLPAPFSFFGGVRTYGAPGTGIISDTIATAYVQQGLSNKDATTDECMLPILNAAKSGLMVTNPCPLDKPFDDPSCSTVGAGEIDARTLACGVSDELVDTVLDDVAVALNGLHPKDVWISRIEANLPQSALGKDLEIQPAASQTTVDNQKQAAIAKNIQVVCGSGGSVVAPGSSKDRSGPGGNGNLVVMVGLGLLSLAAFARRRFAVV